MIRRALVAGALALTLATQTSHVTGVATAAPAATPVTSAAQVSAPQTATVPAGIVRLLRDLSTAWVRRDRAAIERAVIQQAQALQLQGYDNASELSFGRFDFEATTQFSGDLASDRVKMLHPGREVASFHVVERYTVSGIETEPYLEDNYWSFSRERSDTGDAYDGWRLASTTDFDVLGAYSATHLWDSGPVKTASSAHFLLLAHPDQIAKVAPALQVAEKALDDVTKFWPRRGAGKFVLIAPSTGDELSRMFQSTVDLSKFVAFAVGSVDRSRGWKHGGVRIFLQLSRFTGRDDENQRNVFSHELIHAVTRPETGPWVPIWVEEGLATWGASGRTELRAVNAGRPESFPEDWQFSVGSSRDIVNRYVQSQLAMQVLGEKYGVAGVAKFYQALGSRRVSPGTLDYQLRESLRESGLWPFDEWTTTWRSRL